MSGNRPEAIVFVVDDDEAVRHFLKDLIASVGLRTEVFESAQAFVEWYRPDTPGCLLLDIRMPGKSGLELLRELPTRSIELPVIVLTGHGSVPVAVHALKAGAVDLIEKPFNNELLLDRVQEAVAQSLTEFEARATERQISERLGRLTPRERQVFTLVVEGETNKSIGHKLGISEKTVELHRANMMEKMEATSLAALIKKAMVAQPGFRESL